ncbi:MAG: tRNA (adenosine(37)-N6)-threonylcarbamoyltransferase complex transferase subunit TsaD [Eubacteriales bacterium]|nr:tRNA (adenosine(37)-N6)-threonylcarbamoyltransferase complex transferase subunit TsaD [Bacillota bacterium]MBV1728038.1 tRNA (adenosine(37)-N6)-threonylcarbamoyltransferase complex transferase subunit TsaD [Desulforudis sp.]MDQ7788716.1 tRNA (adenosine(37)-N6)-threonylcarbamoyltransferase complex transferase subunit TsaD [Clostridia bacterium]MDZ4043596.1 tRNA (adenosine(37)-N6)-threonylcarbamoyltransferase complex transferase subunit TsaD [Eubacteriales bacterium]MBU4532476.1 tRNA (adenosin
MSVIILGIETSCDETSAAVVADGCVVKSNVIASQVEVHRKYGGVVPEVASRRHLESVNVIVAEALEQAGIGFPDLNAIAVTYGPGLAGSLLVGLMSAKAMAYARAIPLVGVNHLEAHIYANFLTRPDLEFPQLCLVVSGGHTDLFYTTHHGNYKLLGRTRDDAAGEAFDKVARVMGLGYPGGPLIERQAQDGNPKAIDFPRAYLEEGTYDFSFSGLKTAVLNYLERARRTGQEVSIPDVSASFQKAVTDVLVDKVMAAAGEYHPVGIMLAGGVAANSALREALGVRARAGGYELTVPPLVLCTDNAAMVACVGYYKYLRGEFAGPELNAVAAKGLGLFVKR